MLLVITDIILVRKTFMNMEKILRGMISTMNSVKPPRMTALLSTGKLRQLRNVKRWTSMTLPPIYSRVGGHKHFLFRQRRVLMKNNILGKLRNKSSGQLD